jgi:hypothetical protein
MLQEMLRALLQGALPNDTSWGFSPMDQYAPDQHPPRTTLADSLAARKVAVQANAAMEAQQRRMRLAARRSGVDPQMAYMMNNMGGQGGQGAMNPLVAQLMFGEDAGKLAAQGAEQSSLDAFRRGQLQNQQEGNRITGRQAGNTDRHNWMTLLSTMMTNQTAEKRLAQGAQTEAGKLTLQLGSLGGEKTPRGQRAAFRTNAALTGFQGELPPEPPPEIPLPSETLAGIPTDSKKTPDELLNLIFSRPYQQQIVSNPTEAKRTIAELTRLGVGEDPLKKKRHALDPTRWSGWSKFWNQNYYPELGPKTWTGPRGKGPGGEPRYAAEPFEDERKRLESLSAVNRLLQELGVQ